MYPQYDALSQSNATNTGTQPASVTRDPLLQAIQDISSYHPASSSVAPAANTSPQHHLARASGAYEDVARNPPVHQDAAHVASGELANISTPTREAEEDAAQKHSRHASQDINPTPSKRARESGGENIAPAEISKVADASPQKLRMSGSQRRTKSAPTVKENDGHAPSGGEQTVPSGGSRDGKRWNDTEINKLLSSILGADKQVDFLIFEKNPDRYCDKVRHYCGSHLYPCLCTHG